jgi:hypothetical protein
MQLTLADWLTLVLATAGIALALVVEHQLTSSRHWPQRWYYAEGLATVLAGLGTWLAWRAVTVDWLVALALVLAGCAAGGPDWIIIQREERLRETAWNALEADNAELATQLRCLLSKPANSNYMRRLREMVETAAFSTAAMKRERELIELAEQQALGLLQQIQEIVGEGNGRLR